MAPALCPRCRAPGGTFRGALGLQGAGFLLCVSGKITTTVRCLEIRGQASLPP